MDDLLYVLKPSSTDPKDVAAVQVPIEDYKRMMAVVSTARDVIQRNGPTKGLAYLHSMVLTLDMPRYILIHHDDGWRSHDDHVPGYESGSIVKVEEWIDEETPLVATQPGYEIYTCYEPTSWDFRIEDRDDD